MVYDNLMVNRWSDEENDQTQAVSSIQTKGKMTETINCTSLNWIGLDFGGEKRLSMSNCENPIQSEPVKLPIHTIEC
jgi:hypothetical protein